ncbi:major antigen, putative [Entamoeba dispar SAW760]|uniref:Major antigen, putative n=1 Tax=Entamoeba dispar (strain ATCC PRA-260 / SAW760) TaxID=370354 RepID=B0E6U9_ENTDS|nr:major antigen, putative [Entamoeba dispar SAW760]EDR29690.1 major antigen, putative [Entamoeba dispar SAW760]|eukprot:EDR29690.1 major antigen, putative [Entamoeba dispar SAW760]
MTTTEGKGNVIDFIHNGEWTLDNDKEFLEYMKGIHNTILESCNQLTTQIQEATKNINLLELQVRSTGDKFVYISQSQYLENKVAEYEIKEDDKKRSTEIKDIEDDKLFEIALEKGLQMINGININEGRNFVDEIEYIGYPQLSKQQEHKQENTTESNQITTSVSQIGEIKTGEIPPPPPLHIDSTGNPILSSSPRINSEKQEQEIQVISKEQQQDEETTKKISIIEEIKQKGFRLPQPGDNIDSPTIISNPKIEKKEETLNNKIHESEKKEEQIDDVTKLLIESKHKRETTSNKLSNILSFDDESVDFKTKTIEKKKEDSQKKVKEKKKKVEFENLFDDKEDVDVLEILASSLDTKKETKTNTTQHQDEKKKTSEDFIDLLLEKKVEAKEKKPTKKNKKIDVLFNDVNEELDFSQQNKTQTPIERKENIQEEKKELTKMNLDPLFSDVIINQPETKREEPTTTPLSSEKKKEPKIQNNQSKQEITKKEIKVDNLFEDIGIQSNSQPTMTNQNKQISERKDKPKIDNLFGEYTIKSQENKVEKKTPTTDDPLFGSTVLKNEVKTEEESHKKTIDNLFEDDNTQEKKTENQTNQDKKGPNKQKKEIDDIFNIETPTKPSDNEKVTPQHQQNSKKIVDDLFEIESKTKDSTKKIQEPKQHHKIDIDNLFEEPKIISDINNTKNKHKKTKIDDLFGDTKVEDTEQVSTNEIKVKDLLEGSQPKEVKKEETKKHGQTKKINDLFSLDDNSNPQEEKKKNKTKTIQVDELFEDVNTTIKQTKQQEEKKDQSKKKIENIFEEETKKQEIKIQGSKVSSKIEALFSTKEEPKKKLVSDNETKTEKMTKTQTKTKLEGIFGNKPIMGGPTPIRPKPVEQKIEEDNEETIEIRHDGKISRRTVSGPKGRRRPTMKKVQFDEHTERLIKEINDNKIQENNKERIQDLLDGKEVKPIRIDDIKKQEDIESTKEFHVLDKDKEEGTGDSDGFIIEDDQPSKIININSKENNIKENDTEHKEQIKSGDTTIIDELFEEKEEDKTKEEDIIKKSEKPIDNSKICSEFDFDDFF